jgi:RNA polymerase sigma-70 factor (ECF subfamily)
VLGDADEAEDAVQDALVRAWRHRGKLHDTAGLDKWLFVIVKREAIRRLGSPWRRWVILTGQNLIGASKPRAVAGGELWDAVEAAVSGLSVNHRSVVILHAYWDMDFEDIATVLRIPVGTAKSRFARGAVRLRALMAAYEGEQ